MSRIDPNTKGRRIADALRKAIAEKQTHTRPEWARLLSVNYNWLCTIVHDFGLQDACKQLRADTPTGILKVTHNKQRFTPSVRISSAAIIHAGFGGARELRYHAEPGRIILTPTEK